MPTLGRPRRVLPRASPSPGKALPGQGPPREGPAPARLNPARPPWVRAGPWPNHPRSARCCVPSRRTPRRGKERCPTSTRAPAAPAGGTAPLPVHRQALLVPVRAQFEPRQPRQPHLGPQPQQPPRLDLLHAPEVQRVTHPQVLRVPPAPPQPDPADEPVEPSPYRPGQRERVPPVLPADALDDPPQRLPGRVHGQFALVRVEAAAGPVGVGGQRIARGARHRGRRPAGGHLGLLDPAQCQLRGPVERHRAARRIGDVPRDVPLVAHDFVAQRLRERPGDGRRDRRHQADPVARQARGQYRYGHDEAPGESGDRRVTLHHVAVRQHVGAADVERPAHVVGQARAPDEVAQDVADGDGLEGRPYPARRHHHGQPLREVAEHLERGRARADDDGGAQDRGRHPGVQQDTADLGARAQVRRQLALGHPGGGEPAQVDDPPHPRRLRLLGERVGGAAVGGGEVVAGAERVHQVVRDVYVLERRADGHRVGDVAPYDLRLARPRVVAQFVGGTGQAAHRVSRAEQLGHQPAADVPGRPGHQAAQPLGPRFPAVGPVLARCPALPLALIRYVVRQVVRYVPHRLSVCPEAAISNAACADRSRHPPRCHPPAAVTPCGTSRPRRPPPPPRPGPRPRTR